MARRYAYTTKLPFTLDSGYTRGMWNIQRSMPAAREATSQADDASATADDFSRLIEKTAELKSLIQALRPEYEYSGPRSVGGVPVATAYAIRVPFSSPSEVYVAYISNSDPSNAATLTLSTDPNLDLVASNAATMTATLDGNQSFLILATPVAQSVVAGSGCWYPVQANSELYCRVNGAGSNAAYFVLQFRRRINPSGVPNQGYN